MNSSSLITQATTQRAADAYAMGLQARALAAQKATGPAAGQDPQNLTKVRGAAQQFEGFFVGQMMEHMMAGIKTDETFGGGQAEDTWRSMLNQEYGKQIAKSGKLGIADNVMKAMLQAQEQRTAAANAPPMDTAPAATDAAVDSSQAEIAAGALTAPKQTAVE